MLKFSLRVAQISLSGTLAFSGVSCSSDKSITVPQVNQPVTPIAKPAIVSPTPTVVSQPNRYELALDKAYSALSISRSAQSSEDWNLVVRQWSDAIALMKAVPATNPKKALARIKIAEYQRNLSNAQKQATRPIDQTPDSVAILPEIPLPLRNETTTVEVPLQPQSVFQATIKRRAGGTPVIDVTFNGTQKFEMIVDTGASGTVITQQMAAALKVVSVATAKANTASANQVEFSVGYVDSIEAGGATIKDVQVAIAPTPALEIGLLGHDFFGNYDVTLKRDVVEFHPR